MKTAAIHSHKGGVGKTTIALMLAKYAATHGERVCVIDFDFLGCGMADLLFLGAPPLHYVEEYFLTDSPGEFDIAQLPVPYTDKDVEGCVFSIVYNQGRGILSEEALTLQKDMGVMVRNEQLYRDIREKTGILLRKLAEKGFTVAIFDCHPGLGFVSDTVTTLVSLNVYVCTPNRSDFFGLLKDVNLRRLDPDGAAFVVNRVEGMAPDLASLKQAVSADRVIGSDSKTLLAFLDSFVQQKGAFFFLPEHKTFRTWAYVGSDGLLPLPVTMPEMDSLCEHLVSQPRARGTGDAT